MATPPPNSGWNRILDLFHAALEQPAETREAWVEAQAQEDPAIRSEVRSLLVAEAKHERLSAEARAGAREEEVPAPRPGLEEASTAARVGPYQLVRPIGRGGMGAVYLARRADGQFEQTVAVKVMAAHLAGDDFTRKFHRERQTLATLAHPNITRLLDGGVSPSGDPYLVMEFVEGCPLDRFCDQARLTLPDRLRLFLQVCEAVDFAHRNLILHRDLKPDNVLVASGGQVKLLDFGTAALLGETANATVTRTRMLTPRYSSPERLRGERTGIASDVYSLGVMLYELLTGAWPFGNPDSMVGEIERATGSTAPAHPASVVTRDAASLRDISQPRLRRTLAGDLSVIVLKALEHDPARRYETVRQLADDIGSYLAGRPIAARSPTVLYRAGKLLRRRWLPLSAATLFVLGIAAAGVFAAYQARAARAEALRAAEVNRFLRTILASAGSFDFNPREYTVAQMLESAERQLESGPGGDPLRDAVLHSSLASSFYALQENRKATYHLGRAIPVFQSLGDDLELCEALQIEGLVAEAEGRYDDAARSLEEALVRVQRLGRKAPGPVLFETKATLAKVLSFDLHRQKERAERLYREAFDLAERDSTIPRPDVAVAVSAWAGMLVDEGKLQPAESALEKALAAGRKQGASGGLWEMGVLYMLVQVHGRQKDLGGAKDYARQMVDAGTRVVGADHVATAQARLVWASYAVETGEREAALAAVSRAMPVIERGFPSPSLVLWHSARDAAHVLRVGGHLSDAERLARQSLAVATAAHLSAADPRLGNSWEELGRVLHAEKNYGEAVHALDQAVSVYSAAGANWAGRAEEMRRLSIEAAGHTAGRAKLESRHYHAMDPRRR